MIKCNLPVLLAERGLKITKVSNDTGISRTTLTALNNNHSQGIQFDTLNKICNYLKINPGELFLYVPFDINFSFNYNYDILTFTILDNNQKFEYDFYCSISSDKTKCFNSQKKFIGYSPVFEFEIGDFENLEENEKKSKEKIWEYLKKIPFPLYKMLENEILEKINSIIIKQQEESIKNGEWSEEDIEGASVNIYFSLKEIFEK